MWVPILYNEIPNVKRPKVKNTEENWPKSKKAEFNVWLKIIRLNITFGRIQKCRIGAKKGRNSGPLLASCSLWPTIFVYLIITCAILQL